MAGNGKKQISQPMVKIDWVAVKKTLPKTIWPLLEEIQKAYEADQNDPARAVELALQRKMLVLRRRFDDLKKEAGK